jgi:excisionase family DNA binding protein
LLSDFDNHDPDFDVMALVPEHLRENWDETVKHIMEEWDKWSSTEPPPDLLEYGGVSVILDAPVRESAPVVDRLLVDVPEACRILSCGRTLIYDLIRTRELCPVKLGRLTRIPMEGLRALVERKMAESKAWAAKPEWWEKVDWGTDADR